MKNVKKGKLIILEKRDSHRLFDKRIDRSALFNIKGGDMAENLCDPWSSCDAWNCNPDCVCKSNLC